MRKSYLLAVLALVVLAFGACTTASFQGIQAVKDMPNFSVVGEFEKTITDNGLIGGAGGVKLVSFGQPDEAIFSTIQDEIQKLSGDAAINVEIKYHCTFIDMLLTGITGTLISASRITIKGTVVKFN